MNIIQVIKQMWVSIRLEKNPYYYYLVDIQRAINDLHHMMTKHKLTRDQMKDATLYVTMLRDYKKIIERKTGRTDKIEIEQILSDVQTNINSVNKFIKKVHPMDKHQGL